MKVVNGKPQASAQAVTVACGLPFNPDYSCRPEQIRVGPCRNSTNVIFRI